MDRSARGRLSGRRVVLGVSGGIAAYKSAALVGVLRRRGVNVRVVMTESATRFITPLSLRTLSGNAVATSLFDDTEWALEHIALARWADCMVIAPATANVLAKMAAGIADDLLTSVALAVPSPIVVAPAMNDRMWAAPATQANMKALAERGVRVVGPVEGRLASGDVGTGRMAEPEGVADAVEEALAGSPPALRLLVTSGPTREAIDDVRSISPSSTGRLGAAVAEEATRRGWGVAFVQGRDSATPRRAGNGTLELVTVEGVADLAASVADLLSAGAYDAIVHLMAVSDYTPKAKASGKTPSGAESWTVDLVPTQKVLPQMRTAAPGALLVAAKLLVDATEADLVRAAAELAEANGCDLVLANDLGPIRREGRHAAVLVGPGGEVVARAEGKGNIAAALVDWIAEAASRK